MYTIANRAIPNMIDGLNGLCAAIAINALLLVYIDNQYSTGPIIMIGSILGFLLYNVGFFGQKRTIFLGDNGSNFLGLTVAITCVYYADDICSTNIEGNTSGVTMLWLVAIPLWDCIRVILDRLSTKRLPFRPGRDHFHHILLDQGLSANQIFTQGTVAKFNNLVFCYPSPAAFNTRINRRGIIQLSRRHLQ